MQMVLDDNEFTNDQLLEYMKKAYGTQINGNPFGLNILNRWIERGNIAQAYGGNKIEKVVRLEDAGNIRIITVRNLSKSDIESFYGSLNDYEKTLNKKRAVQKIHGSKKPRKLRTELYYQLLGSRNTTIKTKVILPSNYKELGITSKQRKPAGKRK